MRLVLEAENRARLIHATLDRAAEASWRVVALPAQG